MDNVDKRVPKLEVIVLAAGKGTRMKSELPKVLHEICGISMLGLVLKEIEIAARSPVTPMDIVRFNIVVGHKKELVTNLVQGMSEKGQIKTPVVFSVQEEQLGTAHAVKVALQNKTEADLTAVFNGDIPLFDVNAFLEFYDGHRQAKSAASLASAELDNPGRYGRVVRKGKDFTGVVEFKDASPNELEIKEVNGGAYLFETELLKKTLENVDSNNNAKEFYLPDVFSAAKKQKKKIYAHCFKDGVPIRGVNDMKELAEAQNLLYYRTAQRLMASGTFIHEPRHTYIGPHVKVGSGCSIGPFGFLLGESVLEDYVVLGARCELKDITIGQGSVVKSGTFAERSVIGSHCSVGPMAHLRSGTKLGNHVKIGNFVELKETKIGNNTSVSHLSYLGDADVGKDANIGCGFVTCNFDGRVIDGKRKHHSRIGDRAFIGSDCQVIAPIELAEGAYVASGSTVSESVKEKDSFVIARERQVTKPGYASKYRKKPGNPDDPKSDD